MQPWEAWWEPGCQEQEQGRAVLRAVLRAVRHHPAELGLQDLWNLRAHGNVGAEDLISMLHLPTTE